MTWDEFRALVKRAGKGDRESLARVRSVMTSGENPAWAEWVRESFGNPADWLRRSLADWAGGRENPVMAEAIESKLDQVRRELEGPDPTPIERLLAERAAACWFILNVRETLSAQNTGRTIAQAESDSRRINAAHNRFLSAVTALARVRKLAVPALMVNVAHNQQVNVDRSGDGGPG